MIRFLSMLPLLKLYVNCWRIRFHFGSFYLLSFFTFSCCCVVSCVHFEISFVSKLKPEKEKRNIKWTCNACCACTTKVVQMRQCCTRLNIVESTCAENMCWKPDKKFNHQLMIWQNVSNSSFDAKNTCTCKILKITLNKGFV